MEFGKIIAFLGCSAGGGGGGGGSYLEKNKFSDIEILVINCPHISL